MLAIAELPWGHASGKPYQMNILWMKLDITKASPSINFKELRLSSIKLLEANTYLELSSQILTPSHWMQLKQGHLANSLSQIASWLFKEEYKTAGPGVFTKKVLNTLIKF